MEFRGAGSVDEALAWLAELGDEAQVLAGGTDVMIQYMRREIAPSVLLHIGNLDELAGITTNGTHTIGPLITHRTLAADRQLGAAFPALAEAAATVGGWQTQEVGTVGGNLCNASPAADTAPPLLIADADLELRSTAGDRRVPLGEFFLGRRATARRGDELLTGITATPISAGTGETYLKLGRRSAMEVAVVGLAVRLTVDVDDTVTRARVAVCSVSPRPYRAVGAEQLLEGSHLDSEAVADAGRSLVESASPIDDARASASYRLRVLPALLARAVEICRLRAMTGGS